MEIHRAKEIIKQIAKKKQGRIDGGGKDFQGALKRLVGIWSDPGHALIELLQNADDAEASEVGYRILPHGILFNHNGHPFTEPEIQAICSVDDSTKDAEKHTGFMGVGFKAVFKLSASPSIVCPPWQFCFGQDGSTPGDWGWILIPRWIDSIPEEMGKVSDRRTAFWLPYKEELSPDSISRIEEEIFERFGSLCLMFLRHIKKITIETSDGRSRKLRLEKEDTVIEEKDGKEVVHRYKVFRKLFQVPSEAKAGYAVQDSARGNAKIREVVIAFSLDLNGNLQRMTGTPLYTFLLTDYFPPLRFAVQSDFILDTQRSHFDESLEWNCWLLRCVKDLLIMTINGYVDDTGNKVQGFKDTKELCYQFYRVLPVKEDFSSVPEQSPVLTELIRPFLDYCRENPIILASSNTWKKPSDTVLSSPVIQKLLDREKLKEIKGAENFVHPDVHGVKEFLSEIGVVDFQEQDILEALGDEDWVNSKVNEWFSQLYDFLWDGLYDDKKRWQKWWHQEETVKNLPIVKTFSGTANKANEVLFPPKDEREVGLASRKVFFSLEGYSLKVTQKNSLKS